MIVHKSLRIINTISHGSVGGASDQTRFYAMCGEEASHPPDIAPAVTDAIHGEVLNKNNTAIAYTLHIKFK